MKTIEEKNRMIAEFMGFKIDIESINIRELSESQIAFAFDYLMKPFQREKYMLGGIFFEIENVFELKYHTSWDWLMPVIDTIYNTGMDEQTTNEIGDVTHALLDIDMQSTHDAVCKFIEMYNENREDVTW